MTNYFINLPPVSGGGDSTAAYLLVSGTQDGTLTAARTIVAGNNVSLADGGAGGSLVISSVGTVGPSGSAGAPGANGTNGTNGAPGGLIFTPVAGASTTTLNVTGLLLVSTSVGSLNLSLNTGSMGQVVVIKDIQGSASVNPFTVFPTNNAKIDGVSSSYTYYVNYGALKLTCDGKDWFTW